MDRRNPLKSEKSIVISSLIGKDGEWAEFDEISGSPVASGKESEVENALTLFVPKGYCWVHSSQKDAYDSRNYGPVRFFSFYNILLFRFH